VAPLLLGCPKVIIDGSSYGSHSCGAIGGIFRSDQCHFLGGFAHNIRHATSLKVELCATMFAIEKVVFETTNSLEQWFIDGSTVKMLMFSRLQRRQLGCRCFKQKWAKIDYSTHRAIKLYSILMFSTIFRKSLLLKYHVSILVYSTHVRTNTSGPA